MKVYELITALMEEDPNKEVVIHKDFVGIAPLKAEHIYKYKWSHGIITEDAIKLG